MLLRSFSVEVVVILSQPSARSAPVLSAEIGKEITWAKNTSERKEVCLLLPGELLSSLQLIIQHFPGSGPRYDAKTAGRRLNTFLLFALRQYVCVHAFAYCLVSTYVLIQKWQKFHSQRGSVLAFFGVAKTGDYVVFSQACFLKIWEFIGVNLII